MGGSLDSSVVNGWRQLMAVDDSHLSTLTPCESGSESDEDDRKRPENRHRELLNPEDDSRSTDDEQEHTHEQEHLPESVVGWTHHRYQASVYVSKRRSA
jgi:hypothetical protein